ncbi:SulP family inorganic anion transporter [Aquabacterium sp. J223]|uniref:SulP family inorganic anion transporter n=1 Tax=Aquabacterium sp. J223 TaxID=2898431 RepID=UPI003916CDDC
MPPLNGSVPGWRSWPRRLGDWTGELSAATLRADGLAGLLGAVLALPQAIAFARLAGLPPQVGLATAIVPCAVAALAGASRHVVSGPTNALSLALLATLAPLALSSGQPYLQLVLAVTVMVGLVQLAVALLRLGTVAHFISPAVLLGFTSGAALLIAWHAGPDLLGMADGGGPRPAALAVGGLTLGVSLLARRYAARSPFLLIGLLAGTALAALLAALAPGLAPAPTVGPLPAGGLSWQWPQVPWSALRELVPVALALTIVALGQSVSIAKAVAERSGQAVDTNREFFGQGLSNVVGGLCGCYVSCGSLNRSMPNLEAGARTPLAAVFSAALLLLLLLVAADALAWLPLAGVAAVLLLTAWSLLDAAGWRRLRALSRGDFAVALATAAATLALRMEIAILLGTGLSLVAYLHRTSRPAMRLMGFDRMTADRRFVVRDDVPAPLPECPQMTLLRMEGSVYFGAAPHVAERLRSLRLRPDAAPHLLVMAKSMNFIDPAGDAVWQAELKARRAMGGDLYFHAPRPQVLQAWQRSGFLQALGPDHVFTDKRSAIAAIYRRIPDEACRRCPARSTWECATRAGSAEGPYGDL